MTLSAYRGLLAAITSCFIPLGLALSPLKAAESPADADWKALMSLDSGPKEPTTTREQARTAALAFLAKQESALRKFLRDHPADSRAVDARLRLAHLLAVKGDFSETPALYDAALRLLDSMEEAVPENRRADVAFAKISLTMRGVTLPTDADREAITSRMQSFRKQFPNDRRIAGLMAEVATLYDSQPRRKQTMLEEALKAARTDEIRARIHDDLKRLALLGTPVAIQGTTAEGSAVDSEQHRGKVVLVYFFASWSAPSIAALEEIHYLRKTFSEREVAVIGVSLDPTPEALPMLKTGSWPVIWDGKGWSGLLVRSLGINALPTLWILDRKGKLRTLNAKTESEGLIRSLLKEI